MSGKPITVNPIAQLAHSVFPFSPRRHEAHEGSRRGFISVFVHLRVLRAFVVRKGTTEELDFLKYRPIESSDPAAPCRCLHRSASCPAVPRFHRSAFPASREAL